MKNRILACLFGVLAAHANAEPPDTWAFAPGRDTYSDAALLDLSYLNEETAGATGFIRRSADGADFVRGDGTPIRFWAVNSYVARKGLPALREHARFLAKRGVNMVRLHGQIPAVGESGGTLQTIDRNALSRLWQLVAAMRAEGIYVTFSPYYPHAVDKKTAARWEVPVDSEGLTGLIYFDPVLQEAYKGWLRQILVPVNPHTGLALKDDPALAIIQMQNEDSLLFWTLNGLRGREARILGQRFAQFLESKYGTLTRAQDAWGGADAPGPIDGMADDWQNGVIALSNIWHLTGEAGVGRAEARLRDQAEFLARIMRDWHAEVARFLRDDIGAPQLFNAGNWRTADNVLMDDLERYAYTSGDIVGLNRYVTSLHAGKYRGWAIVEGDSFREDGLLGRPLNLPAALRQPKGLPYIIPETLWVPPIWQQAEGPLLMAAYQALTGVDISYWFAANEIQWRAPQSANGYLPSIGKWVVATPQLMGSFPAAVLIFRQGLLDQAAPVVVEHRSLDELWSRSGPVVAAEKSYDPNRDDFLSVFGSFFAGAANTEPRVSPYSFLAGPVEVVFDSDEPDFIHPELDRLIDTDRQRVTSLTGQLVWDWSEKLVTLDAPRVQGVLGNLAARGEFDLQDIRVESSAPYASVVVVALDDQPIASAERLLVQIGSVARPTGWQALPMEHESGPALQVEAFGTAPWQVDRVEARLILRNAQVSRATVLDPNGMALRQIPLSRGDGSVAFDVPQDALYVVID